MSVKKLESLLHRLENKRHKRSGERRKRGRGGYLGVGHRAEFGMDREDDYHNMITGSGGALMGGDWLNQSGTMGGALMGGWDNMAGGALMGGDWLNQSGTQGGSFMNRRHKRHVGIPRGRGGYPDLGGGALMGGDWDNLAGLAGGVHRRRRRRGHGGSMDDYQHVGSDWQNMPGYMGGAYYMAHPTRGVVNFANNRGFYPPPNYDLRKFNAPMVKAARHDMRRRNMNSSHYSTANPSGVGSGRARMGHMPRQLSAWNQLVDKVQRSHNCDRKDAMKMASAMYRKKR